MAKNFYDCAKNGGKIINRKDKEGKTLKICYDNEGKAHFKNQNKGQHTGRGSDASSTMCNATVSSLQELAKHFNNKRQ